MSKDVPGIAFEDAKIEKKAKVRTKKLFKNKEKWGKLVLLTCCFAFITITSDNFYFNNKISFTGF